MAVLKITPFDILTSRLRIALEEIAQLDVDLDLQTLRDTAHAELQKLVEEASKYGYTIDELYDYVISGEEGLADFEAEQIDSDESGE